MLQSWTDRHIFCSLQAFYISANACQIVSKCWEMLTFTKEQSMAIAKNILISIFCIMDMWTWLNIVKVFLFNVKYFP